MKKHAISSLLVIGLTLALLPAAFAQAPPAAPAQAAPKPPEPQFYPERVTVWEKAIANFETRDKEKGAPAPGCIVFAGSSSIVMWQSLKDDFPGLPTINRGFGGSQIRDSTYYAGRIVTPYKPSTIVFYAGDNDLALGSPVEQVIGDFQAFARRVRTELPDVKILYLAIKPSPSRWKLEPQMLTVNKGIAEWMKTQKNMEFVDVHTPMLGADGKPRQELYREDNLHMKPEGYKLWTGILAPYLK